MTDMRVFWGFVGSKTGYLGYVWAMGNAVKKFVMLGFDCGLLAWFGGLRKLFWKLFLPFYGFLSAFLAEYNSKSVL